MNRIILIAVAAAGLLASCSESLDDRAARELKEYTAKKCPVALGNGITLDSAVYEPPTRTLHYHYTVEGVADDPKILDATEARGLLLGELKNSTQLRTYKEAGFRFAYTYHSAKHPGVSLVDVAFGKGEY